ncbi:MAG: hypothetical protein ACRDKU_00450 [Gaiellaceae bacterium]
MLRLLDQREAIADDELTPRELPPATLPTREVPAGDLAFGEVCIVDADFGGGTLLVCVVLGRADGTPETVEVAPVSIETGNATDWDLLIAPEDGPLGYRAMVEIWNHGTILTDQVVERFGLLVVDGQHRINAMYKALLADEEPPADVPRGVAVLADDDPRTIFQEEEAERVRPFWQPAARMFAEKAPEAAATVGTLLSQWLDREGFDTADFARDLGWPQQDVLLVCADQFDPQKFASDRLVEALRRTDISSEDIEAGLWQTIQPDHFAFGITAIEQRAAFRRTAGRRAVERRSWIHRGAAAASLPSEERERRRKQYINEVLEGLEEKRGF